MYKKDLTLFVGIVTFICAMIILSFLFGPATCRDGWQSPSIGSRGACSWHGGVDRTKGLIKFLLSLGISFGAANFYSSRKQKREKNNHKQAERVNCNYSDNPIDSQWELKSKIVSKNKKETENLGVMCPVCEKHMILRKARKGRNTGSLFWGCSSFPQCRGTRNYSAKNE